MVSATDKEIFIKILNEDIDVWRPVKAVQIAQYIFKITDTTKFESELDEILEFKQGDIVKCKEKRRRFLCFWAIIKKPAL